MSIIKGVVTAELRNIDSNEVEYTTGRMENTLLSSFYETLYTEAAALGNSNIHISDAKNVNNKFTSIPIDATGTFDIAGFLPPNEYWPQCNNDTANQRYIITFKNRFNPDATNTRTINTIYLFNNNYNSNYYQGQSAQAKTALALTTPCTQTNQQILDIYYEIIIDYSQQSYSTSPDFNREYVTKDLLISTIFDGSASTVTYGYLYDANNLPNPYIYGATGSSYNVYSRMQSFPVDFNINELTYISDLAGTNTYNPPTAGNYNQGTKSYTASYAIGDAVGSLMKDLVVSYKSKFRGNPGNDINYLAPVSKAKLIKPTDSPIQSSYLKNTTNPTIYPYLDPSSIGSSTGTMTLDGSSWGDTTKSLMFKITINNAGNAPLAGSSYNFKVRQTGGFANNNLASEYSLPIFCTQGSSTRATRAAYSYGGYYKITDRNFVMYNNPLAGYLLTGGISFYDPLTSDYTTFDALSTPALVTNAITGVASGPDGSTYIATKDAGLLVLNPAKTTVTPYTGIGTGITDNLCYGVDVRNNGDVWAVFNGGIACLPSGTSTWVIYNPTSTPSFICTGVSDNNWANVISLQVNKTSADAELAIGTTGNAIVTWSPTTLITPVVFTGIPTVQAGLNYRTYLRFLPNSSAMFIVGGGYGYIYYTTFGQSSTTQLPFDYNNNYYSNSMAPVLYNGNYVMDIAWITNQGASDPSRRRAYFDATGSIVFNFNTNTGYNFYTTQKSIDRLDSDPAAIVLEQAIVYPTLITDPNNMAWNSYGWDAGSSTWVLGNTNFKPMHTDAEALYDGIKISFADASSGSNFVNGEYWFTYVFDGLHKDNSTTATFGTYAHVRDNYNTTLLSANTVPAALGQVTQEYNFNTLVNDGHYQHRGSFGRGRTDTNTAANALKSEITATGDFALSFVATPLTNGSSANPYPYIIISLTDSVITPAEKYGFIFDYTGFAAWESGTKMTTSAALALGDTFGITRTGSTVSYLHNGSVFYTSTVASSAPLTGLIRAYGEYTRTITNMTLTYNETRPVLTIGDQGTQKGIFDPNFVMVEAYITNPPTYSVTINGNPATVWTDPTVTPNAGECVLLQKNGWLVFNPADTGKPVTSNMQILLDL